MLFDAHAALAQIEADTGNEIQHPTPAISAISAIPQQSLIEISPRIAGIAEIAAPRPFCQKPQKVVTIPTKHIKTDEYRHGGSVVGTPLAWTGKVVSLDEWRTLSKWDKHGPDGRLFNGITKQWEWPE